MRFRFDNPTDRRLRTEFGNEGDGFFVELLFVDDDQPTVRFGGSDGEEWDPARPLFWEAVNVLALLGFVSVSEIHDAMEALDRSVPPVSMNKRLRAVAELVQNLREALEAA
jgi:hypothetical protein